MSERTLRQLVGAFTVLALAWVALTLVGRGSGSIEPTGEVTRAVQALASGAFDEIRFERAAGTVVLTRAESGWSVDGHPVDPVTLGRFMDVLRELEVGDLTATNPANHDRMGVSADSATVVTVVSAGREQRLLLGKAGRRFGTSYLRLPESEDVYLLEGDLRSQALRDRDGWRDRTIVQVDTSAVERIEVEGSGRGYALVRTDAAWTHEGGAEVDPAVVQGILSELSAFMATGFLEDGDPLATAPEASSTTVRSAGGTILAMVRLGEGDAERWARLEGGREVYRVSAFRADRVAPPREAVSPGG